MKAFILSLDEGPEELKKLVAHVHFARCEINTKYKERLKLDRQTRRKARTRGFLENMSHIIGYGSIST
jgi:hypothetical protein